MLEKAQQVAENLNNGVLGESINKIGLAGMGGGAGLAAGSGFSFHDLLAYAPHTWTEWSACVSILCAGSLIIKTIFLTIFECIIKARKVKEDARTDKQ